MKLNLTQRISSRAFAALLTLALLAAPLARAEVKLPAIISDHMVLQQGLADPIWGWASPGEQVTVTLGEQTKTATTGQDGKWMLKLDPLQVGGPLTLKVQGKNTLTVSDVLVGENWLCSGQSNMAMNVKGANNFEVEAQAANFPKIRMFHVTTAATTTTQADCQGQWVVCTPETVGAYSATAYFFGREIHKSLGVPVGLIKSCVGGTPIEYWISREAQEKTPELAQLVAAIDTANRTFNPVKAMAQYQAAQARWKKAAAMAKAAGQPVPKAPLNPVVNRRQRPPIPGGLFNGMIAPLVPYGIRGAIWYQGEANSGREKVKYYQTQLGLLARDWRTRWGQGDFPFAWVQLPNYNAPNNDWPRMREQMLQALQAIPYSGMAIAIDIGEPANIHPKNKQEVGRRLSLWALNSVYGKPCPMIGPLPAGSKAQGSEIVVNFTHAEGGLKANGGELRGFTIAGADKQWKPATARIEGETVVVSSPEVKAPVAVRYAWADNPDCNLANGAGLPASPFRTDQW